MLFKRINQKTINCIISAQDLDAHGIRLDDLFRKREEAINSLKNIVVEAAEQENFDLDGNYTQMRIAVLPDRSLSLTLTAEGDALEEVMSEHQDRYQSLMRVWVGDKKEEDSDKAKETDEIDEYVICFPYLNSAIQAAKTIADEEGYTSSLYRNDDSTEYYLIPTRTQNTPGREFEKLVLSMSEFGTILNEGTERIAYIREHETCILKDKAALMLASL